MNSLLMLVFIIILYISLKKYENMKSVDNTTILDDTENDTHSTICDDEFKDNYPYIVPEYIKFDYNPNPSIIEQYKKEQQRGSNMTIKYGNKFAKSVNKDGKINYGYLKDYTKNPDEFEDTKVIYNDIMYTGNVTNVDGIIHPKDIKQMGKSIQEVYDNNIVDFKKLIDKKDKHGDGSRAFTSDGASKLSYLLDDDWTYDNEKPENGGQILEGFYAFDPHVHNTPAMV